jgi:hypothetical protein
LLLLILLANPASPLSKKSDETCYLFSKSMTLKNFDKQSADCFLAQKPTHVQGQPVAPLLADRTVKETKIGMLVFGNKDKSN